MKQDVTSPRSVTRLLGLFETMARAGDGLSLAQLSVALESPKSSLLLMLRPLVEKGYLMHSGSVYRLGPAVFRLSADILSARNFPKLVRPFMQDLVERSRETVFLAVIDREARAAAYVETIESPQAVRYTAPVGSTRPLYASSAGRCLLAWQDGKWLDHYLRTVKPKSLTPRTITDRLLLRREIEIIRRDGVAVSIDEAVPGAAGVAAPIFGSDGGIAASLLIGAPVDRFERELPILRKLVKEVAARASGVLAVSRADTVAGS